MRGLGREAGPSLGSQTTAGFLSLSVGHIVLFPNAAPPHHRAEQWLRAGSSGGPTCLAREEVG